MVYEPGTRSSYTDDLWGYTVIRRIEYVTDLSDGVCTLVLDLANDYKHEANAIRVEFVKVSSLSIGSIGGGISQFPMLIVEDIHERQLEGINYQVYEDEYHSLSLLCQSISITHVSTMRY